MTHFLFFQLPAFLELGGTEFNRSRSSNVALGRGLFLIRTLGQMKKLSFCSRSDQDSFISVGSVIE